MKTDNKAIVSHLGALIVGTAGVLWALALSSQMIEKSLRFHQTPPTPLRANLSLLSFALAGIIVLVLAMGIGAWRVPRAGKWVAAACAGPLSLAGIAVLASFHPGSGPYVDRERVRADNPARAERLFVLPIFFDHANASLRPVEKAHLRDLFAVFRDCVPEEIRVRGFASSARFQEDSDFRNRVLANRRAQVVSRFIEDEFQQAAAPVEWNEYQEMDSQRRLRDVGLKGERLLDLERLNRRAEIVWKEGACLGQLLEEVPAGEEDAPSAPLPAGQPDRLERGDRHARHRAKEQRQSAGNH